MSQSASVTVMPDKFVIDTNSFLSITWVDSTSRGGWMAPSDFNKIPTEIRTVGFLLSEDEETITLTNSVGAECILDPLTIPKVAVVGRIQFVF